MSTDPEFMRLTAFATRELATTLEAILCVIAAVCGVSWAVLFKPSALEAALVWCWVFCIVLAVLLRTNALA